MSMILTDGDGVHERLKPLTFTKAVADLRVGILTFRERWEKHLGEPVTVSTQDYLQVKYGTPGQGKEQPANFLPDGTEIAHVWDFFKKNGEAIVYDFELLTSGRTSAPISATNTVIGSRIFVEEGARMEGAIINCETGPVYIGRNAEVMEGSLIRGPFALCKGATLKMGAKIYGPTTIGPHCKVGGEVSNSVIMGFSNKAHDGFVGNSVIGEWCNLGADTNTSNLKNNYGNVRVWSYESLDFIDSQLQFCGLIMGDHSKCGINTMFNTGTVVGVNANVFNGNFPPKHIPSFSWGGADGSREYQFDKAMEVASTVMERRGVELTAHDRSVLKHVFGQTAWFRK